MTANEKMFIENIKRAVPDSKDNERVEKILADFPGDATDPVVMDRRSKKAVLQLNRITDHDKFFRRIKAFLDAGIKIDFSKVQVYTEYNTAAVLKHLNAIAKCAAECMCDEIDYEEEFVL